MKRQPFVWETGNQAVESMFTPAALFGSFLFGLIGMAAFAYGKKESRVYPMLFGAALMAFPYFVTNTWAMYGVGAGLTGMLVKMRDS